MEEQSVEKFKASHQVSYSVARAACRSASSEKPTYAAAVKEGQDVKQVEKNSKSSEKLEETVTILMQQVACLTKLVEQLLKQRLPNPTPVNLTTMDACAATVPSVAAAAASTQTSPSHLAHVISPPVSVEEDGSSEDVPSPSLSPSVKSSQNQEQKKNNFTQVNKASKTSQSSPVAGRTRATHNISQSNQTTSKVTEKNQGNRTKSREPVLPPSTHQNPPRSSSQPTQSKIHAQNSKEMNGGGNSIPRGDSNPHNKQYT